ncbi:MAG: hypothetical protein J5544_02450 [Clostridia bacterium]|nr:hypothetical protein [Clostridia bacterium]
MAKHRTKRIKTRTKRTRKRIDPVVVLLILLLAAIVAGCVYLIVLYYTKKLVLPGLY